MFITGGGGDDRIVDGAFDDFMNGKDGNDWLVAGDGKDELTGGGGADRFVFTELFEGDLIRDFQDTAGPEEKRDGLDVIDFKALREALGDPLSFKDLLIEKAGRGVSVRLDLDRDGVADVVNVEGAEVMPELFVRGARASDLGAADFLF